MMTQKMKICFIAGARPNFMKIAALIEACKKYPDIEYILIHTGQHYDDAMSKVFFDELCLPRPDYNLGVGGKDAEAQKREIVAQSVSILGKYKPDVVIVVGDVTSTLAGTIAAKSLGIKVAHVEAGLRSKNYLMPEELNRIEVDHASDFLFASEPIGLKNLEEENFKGKKYLVGNVMIDTLKRFEILADKSDILRKMGLASKKYALATLHRKENLESGKLRTCINMLQFVGEKMPVIFPVHPNTRDKIINEHGYFLESQHSSIKPIYSSGYIDFLCLMKNTAVVITDSGGIQEETTILDVPCLTLRNETERPITVEKGTNEIVSLDEKKIKESIEKIMKGEWKHAQKIENWDGHAAERIIEILYKELSK